MMARPRPCPSSAAAVFGGGRARLASATSTRSRPSYQARRTPISRPAGLRACRPPETGPGGTYARLAEPGHGPVRFREEIRSRMPGAQEAERLESPAGVPVVLVARTAFDSEGLAVEVNEMVLDSSAYDLDYDFEA